MQVPGPTLIVTEGDTVTVTLTNNLPPSAGNTSILFPGFSCCNRYGSDARRARSTKEAANGGTVTYTIHSHHAGTHSYYSGTQSDLQIEMGLYGAIIVLPASTPPAECESTGPARRRNCITGRGRRTGARPISGWRPRAYNNPKTCYDREYLFQFSEMDPAIHVQALSQVQACGTHPPACTLHVPPSPITRPTS